MKAAFILFLLPLTVWSKAIPLESFEQSKLEGLMQRIPVALTKTEEKNGFVRKFYSYPAVASNFTVKCEADHYNSSPVASTKKCSLNVTTSEVPGMKYEERGDSIVIRVTNEATVSELFAAIPYSQSRKEFKSNEQVYGQLLNGNYGMMFRYAFSCDVKSCLVSLSTKASN